MRSVAGSFACGWISVRLLLTNASAANQVFLAASLTATSVGVTARVLKDLRQTRSGTAHVILGAAVVDDVVALSLLAILGVLRMMPVTVNAGSFLVIAAFAVGLAIDGKRSQTIDRLIAPVARWLCLLSFLQGWSGFPPY